MRVGGIIRTAVVMGAGICTGAVISSRLKNHDLYLASQDIERLRSYYNVLNQWLSCKISGEKLETFFEKNKYDNIAIYGMGNIGILLRDELEHAAVHVAYGIDQNASMTYAGVEMYKPDEKLPKVDAVIVTVEYDLRHIREIIEDNFICPVIPLSQVINEI